MKAIIPTKMGMPTVKTVVQNQRDNNEELKRQLNWANEKQKAKSCGYPNNFLPSDGNFSVQQKSMTTVFFFLLGSLVLKRVFENIAELGARKLQVNWEGPYIVIKAGNLGTYHLQTLDGVPLFCPWNLTNLKQYYQ